MSRQPILQQYYTRGRQGVFRSNEGYDTVAKSPGLDNTFIKKALHPFCVYDAPRELQERAESDPALYPEAFISFRAESGELVIGRSVFVGADFTGQRNTFFSHNYVIPAERREEFIRDPAKLFGIQAFANHHETAAGKELPPVLELPYQSGMPKDPKQWLSGIGVDERTFKQLLYALMVSLGSKRKVYVSLDGDAREASAAARRLLEVLSGCLPYEMRRHLGFVTYSSEPQSKKHIHVMFVEKGSIRSGSGISEKDFLFDLAYGRIAQVDWQEGAHSYLDFAWEYLGQHRVLDSFHAFCEEVLAGADPDMRLRLVTYYELCALYEIEKGQMAKHEQNRAGVWQVLHRYLSESGLVNKERLLQLRSVLFREEAAALAAKKLPESEAIKQMLAAYSAIPKEPISTELVLFLMDVLLKGKGARRTAYVAEVYRYLSGSPELFGYVMRTVFGHKQVVKPLFEDYAVERLASFSQIGPTLQEIEFWANTAPQALRNASFMTAAKDKLLGLFSAEGQKLQAALHIHDFFERLEGAGGYADPLLDELDKALLKQIRLDSLAWGDFAQVVVLLEEKPQTFFGELDLESRQKLEHIQKLAILAGNREVPLPEDFFRGWDEREMAIQQKLIGSLMDTSLEPDSFPLVALVFYRAERQGQDSFAYADMLKYVCEHGGEEVLFSFVQWSMKQRMFFTGKYVAPGYRQALKGLLLEGKGRRLRDKEWRKRWFSVRHADFRKLLEEVRSETASPIVKLFQRKSTAWLSLAILIVAGAAGGYLLFQPDSSADLTPLPAEGVATDEPGTSGAEGSTEEAASAKFIPAYQLMLEPKILPVNAVQER